MESIKNSRNNLSKKKGSFLMLSVYIKTILSKSKGSIEKSKDLDNLLISFKKKRLKELLKKPKKN